MRSDIINYTVIKETSTALNLFEDGQLDVATLSGELAQQNKIIRCIIRIQQRQ